MKKNFFLLMAIIFQNTFEAQKRDSGIKDNLLTVFAESNNQWTGIAISKESRVFVNFPKWSKKVDISVGELINGNVVAFPNKNWNMLHNSLKNEKYFVCVQSIFIDKENHLWVLDTGYQFETDKTQKAVLYNFDIKKRKLLKKYVIPSSKISPESYLNDFRIDFKNNVVYFTDSNLGGIVILDLKTENIHRILSHSSSTHSEVKKIIIEGIERNHPVHSDGIELDEKNGYLYYCSLMGKNLYRIKTQYLLDKKLSEEQCEEKVEIYAETGPNDGIWLGKNGEIYLTSLEKNAISKLDKNRKLEIIVFDSKISWPDSFAEDQWGNLYFTTSQIHLPVEKRVTFKIFKIAIEQK